MGVLLDSSIQARQTASGALLTKYVREHKHELLVSSLFWRSNNPAGTNNIENGLDDIEDFLNNPSRHVPSKVTLLREMCPTKQWLMEELYSRSHGA